MKTPFNIICLSCFQISSQCFIVLDIRVICMQINWVLHVFYDCEKLQVGMHITCSGARYRSCMHEKMRFHPCAFRSWAQNNWKGWIVWLGGGGWGGVGWGVGGWGVGGVNQHSSKFLNLSTKTSRWGHLFRT